jgi:hypothetical protein
MKIPVLVSVYVPHTGRFCVNEAAYKERTREPTENRYQFVGGVVVTGKEYLHDFSQV